ncbi:hypothetical protein CTI12_AA077850 [Artemisia annua]|uniref:Reverse transcriptase domain-containing protein n=1 Tax=Artemisia annua TaxID=35608 RepID=A0A2U1Q449_ARTAN|nr:hypothetical protein CTI12_AA077850 [Artemisia annua]
MYRKTTMKFCVVQSPSPYNVILGRNGLKELRAIPSTIHSMAKFPTPKGIATLTSGQAMVLECRRWEENRSTGSHTRTSPKRQKLLIQRQAQRKISWSTQLTLNSWLPLGTISRKNVGEV